MQPTRALTRPTRRQAARPHAVLLCAMLLAMAALLAACGDDNADQGPLEIIGNYTDEFGDTHAITSETWDYSNFGTPVTFSIITYNNNRDFFVAENDPNDPFNPGLFSRFNWTPFDGNLWYCQNPFDAASAGEAFAAPEPDRTDPSVGGCGGFFWTNLTP